MALLQRQSKTETAMHRVMVALLKNREGEKKVDEMISDLPLKFLPSRTLLELWASWYFSITQDRAHGFRVQGKTQASPRATSHGVQLSQGSGGQQKTQRAPASGSASILQHI